MSYKTFLTACQDNDLDTLEQILTKTPDISGFLYYHNYQAYQLACQYTSISVLDRLNSQLGYFNDYKTSDYAFFHNDYEVFRISVYQGNTTMLEWMYTTYGRDDILIAYDYCSMFQTACALNHFNVLDWIITNDLLELTNDNFDYNDYEVFTDAIWDESISLLNWFKTNLSPTDMHNALKSHHGDAFNIAARIESIAILDWLMTNYPTLTTNAFNNNDHNIFYTTIHNNKLKNINMDDSPFSRTNDHTNKKYPKTHAHATTYTSNDLK